METQIKRIMEILLDKETENPKTRYNPDRLQPNQCLKVQSIECTEEYTRIDFHYRSSEHYHNGGWIQMDKGAYIQPVNSSQKYTLVKAIGIPIAPLKHYFSKQGEHYTYTLIFPALPKKTKKINIIEKEAPGNYFNFYNVDYSKWMTVPHAADLPVSKN
jgi:hypothetical protein